MSVLATIPARAGSKGVKGKNMREINGLSLVDRVVKSALGVSKCDGGTKAVISTDIEEIHLGRYKHLPPDTGRFIISHPRPPELCTDTALAWDVWQDAVKAAEKHFNRSWEYHLYLEPNPEIS